MEQNKNIVTESQSRSVWMNETLYPSLLFNKFYFCCLLFTPFAMLIDVLRRFSSFFLFRPSIHLLSSFLSYLFYQYAYSFVRLSNNYDVFYIHFFNLF